ncbi:MAG: ABC-type nitrate/sulfonate/bicarbonate transport system, periplasmic component [Firmicutes bacterium]|nr:ABC-type nitrate/sulfonate/bicarbonate transport system, periplasmic component [Bacillota bacterium]
MKKIILMAILLIFLIGIVGCTKNTADKTETLAGSDVKVVKIAYLPITHALPLFVEKELQNQADSKIKIELVKYGSWPELMDALNTGKVDGASVLIELALKAKEQGIDLKAVALGHKDGNVVIVNKDINSVADLKGKTFAIPHKQSSHNLLLDQMLADAGITKKDVKIVEMAPAEMPSALSQGQIAGYCVAEPFGAKAVSLGIGKVLYQSPDLWKDSICCALVFNNAFIQSNKDAAMATVSQYQTAGKYITEHKAEANGIAKKYMNVDDSVLDLSLNWISYNDLEIKRDAYEDLITRMKRAGLSENSPAYDDFVDASLWKK